MNLNTLIHQFFDQYLPRIKGSSRQTIRAYRDTYRLLVPFAAKYHGIKIRSLKIGHLSNDMILDFLDYLEKKRLNKAVTRNHRLAGIKSMAKMIRFMHPERSALAQRILSIPQKRSQKQLIGFLYPDEVLNVFEAVDLKTYYGFRDYTILNLLYDSGARASEMAGLTNDFFDPENNTLAILGKGNQYRQIELLPKTVQLVKAYVTKYRKKPNPLYQRYLFVNQRGTSFTRHGINRICKKYLRYALSSKRLRDINPAHSFRHSCAVRMLLAGKPLSEIKNRLGHENIQSTMTYLHMELTHKRDVQKKFIEYSAKIIKQDPKIEDLIDWENKQETLAWLDTL
ncbi:MAG: tyrosine-type recombinase/integrase [Deltaproteobacteria bacterium]|jgi:integrase/recombinase XerD|nr:tyrosine-type recombinase/integrase [Deltaproteobacteria bacterium]